MYKVMIDVWSTIKDDYITGEYSGILHNSKSDAQKELIEAILKADDYIKDIYIKEV